MEGEPLAAGVGNCVARRVWPAAATGSSAACRCPASLRPAPLPPQTPLGIFPPAPNEAQFRPHPHALRAVLWSTANSSATWPAGTGTSSRRTWRSDSGIFVKWLQVGEVISHSKRMAVNAAANRASKLLQLETQVIHDLGCQQPMGEAKPWAARPRSPARGRLPKVSSIRNFTSAFSPRPCRAPCPAARSPPPPASPAFARCPRARTCAPSGRPSAPGSVPPLLFGAPPPCAAPGCCPATALSLPRGRPACRRASSASSRSVKRFGSRCPSSPAPGCAAARPGSWPPRSAQSRGSRRGWSGRCSAALVGEVLAFGTQRPSARRSARGSAQQIQAGLPRVATALHKAQV